MKKMMALLISCALAVGLMVVPAEAYDMGKVGEYQTVSLGGTHTAAIKTDGSLWVWGRNDSGQVGNGGGTDASSDTVGNLSYQSTPVKVLDNVVSVSCGDYHTAAIKADGSLWVWGSNEYGQVGNGGGNASNNGKPIQTTPVKVLDNVAAVACGGSSTAAIKTDGTLWIWGYVDYPYVSAPKKVMDHVAAVSCDNSRFCVIKQDGTLWMWGGIYKSGIAASIKYTNPMRLASGVASVSCDGDSIAYIKNDGTVWTWGSNSYGQRGDGTLNRYDLEEGMLPTQVQGLSNAVSISCGKSFCHVAVVLVDGSLWMWGSNHYGQLGNGLTGNAQDGTDPVQTVPIKIMDQVASAFCGSNNTAVIKNDGSLWTWGDNFWDVLGYHEGDRWYTIGTPDGSARWSAQTTPKQVTDFSVRPSGKAAAQPTTSSFTDTPSWCAKEAQWAVEQGITNGAGSADRFAPTQDCAHEQILTFLWRAAGKPTAAQAPVTVASYYQDGVNWAYEKGFLDSSFQPSAPCTRAQAVWYIWKALGEPQAAQTVSFPDVDSGASYANAVSWALEKGVATGDGGAFVPDRTCGRGEIACFLYRAYN